MVTLIESTVSVTIRHSDSAPIASEAATVSVSRDEATGAERPSKPAPPCDRVMVEILHCAGESPATSGDCNRHHRQHCGGTPSKSGEMTAIRAVMPAIPVVPACFGVKPRRQYRPGRRSRRRAASPWRRIQASARPAATMCGSPGMSRGHNRSGRRHGCSRRARYRRP